GLRQPAVPEAVRRDRPHGQESSEASSHREVQITVRQPGERNAACVHRRHPTHAEFVVAILQNAYLFSGGLVSEGTCCLGTGFFFAGLGGISSFSGGATWPIFSYGMHL